MPPRAGGGAVTNSDDHPFADAVTGYAVYRATGHRFRDLPMSPRRITEELHGL